MNTSGKKNCYRFLLFTFLFCLLPVLSVAQHEHHDTEPEKPAQETEAHDMHQHHGAMETDPVSQLFMQQASGTALNPAAAPMHMTGKTFGEWQVNFHALTYLNVMQQTGPRGDDDVFSTNWFMGTADRKWGPGRLQFRSMISLEPATVSDRRYPLLFQTGETAYDEPIVDGQHPHDFFMELSAQYALSLNEKTIMNIYFGPRGDPALGPVGFPHRVSALEIPQATLSHHYQDSTHIATNVLTVGLSRDLFRVEASAFHGTEPDEGRWDIDGGALNSWAARFTLTPSPNWNAQVSIGRLDNPEVLEEGDILRSTASVTYFSPLRDGYWTASVIWGRNHKYAEDRSTDSLLFEGAYNFRTQNYITGRIETVEKDELFGHGHDDDHGDADDELELPDVFRINSFTFGYTRDFDWIPGWKTGLGGNFTFYSFPSVLKQFYGDRPVAFLFFVRFKQGH